MSIINFEFAVSCSGFLVDAQFALRSEKCCVELRFEKALRTHKVKLDAFRKIFIEFSAQHEDLKIVSAGFKVMWVSYPFNCAKYFELDLEQRVQMLGDLCEEVLVKLFHTQETPLDQLNLALADVHRQGFAYEENIGKAAPSPDRRYRAILKFLVTGDRCEVFATLSDTKKRTIVQELLITRQPSFCFRLTSDNVSLEWTSNAAVRVTLNLPLSEVFVQEIDVPIVSEKTSLSG